MTKSLPSNPSLEHIRKEAKAILKAHKAGDASCCAVLRNLHQFKDKPDEQVLAAKTSLVEVQFALAMEYDFKNWDEMKRAVEHDERRAELATESVEAFCSKGPTDGRQFTEWATRQWKVMQRLLAEPKDGFTVAKEMVRHPHGRVRRAAANFYGQTGGDAALRELRTLLRDESVGVRLDALRAYARVMHPDGPDKMLWAWSLSKTASAVPGGVEAIIEMLDDNNYRVRNEAVCALGAYRQCDDAGVDAAFRKALADTKHKVCHTAARILDMKCPKCGEALKLSRYLTE